MRNLVFLSLASLLLVGCQQATTPTASTLSKQTSSLSQIAIADEKADVAVDPGELISVNIALNLKVLLYGAYLPSGLMRTTLKQKNLIPLFSQTGQISIPEVFAANPIVDWLIVEIRNPAGDLVALQSVLLKDDGEAIDVNGSKDLLFNNIKCLDNGKISCREYKVAVRHRNHISAITEGVVSFPDSGAAEVDFINQRIASQLSQESGDFYGLKNVAVDGAEPKYALYAGDVNGNGILNYLSAPNVIGDDRLHILACLGGNEVAIVSNQYSNCDVNLDSSIRYAGINNDRAFILRSLGSDERASYSAGF